MNVRERAAQIIDQYKAVPGGFEGAAIADRLMAEGLLNVHEMYAAVGEVEPGDRIVVNDPSNGPVVYVVTDRSDNEATGDSDIIGYREHTNPGAPVLVLSAPGSIHVRKVVE